MRRPTKVTLSIEYDDGSTEATEIPVDEDALFSIEHGFARPDGGWQTVGSRVEDPFAPLLHAKRASHTRISVVVPRRDPARVFYKVTTTEPPPPLEPVVVAPREIVGEASHVCTIENGPRPAGPPDHCFYCGVPVGEEHRRAGDPLPMAPTPADWRMADLTGMPPIASLRVDGCVLRRKRVTLHATVALSIPVPEHWTVEDARRHYGDDGSWCADNLVGWLNTGTAEGSSCLCPSVRFIAPPSRSGTT